jgi:hypothetical protein
MTRAVVFVTAVAALAAGACASNRTPERSFAARAEAAQAGMFDTAGVPAALVPPSAKNLRERRDVRSGEIWARFEFEAADRAAMEAACPATVEVRLPGGATRGIGWWPEMLRDDPATARAQFTLHVCDAGGFAGHAFLAVHRSLETAFYWRRAS